MHSPNASKKKPDVTVSFLQITNPEVFEINPRPGGVVQIKPFNYEDSWEHQEELPPPSPNTLISSIGLTLEEKISREFRVQTALEEDYSSESLLEPPAPDSLSDSLYMLAVAISTIILMAANYQTIPENYFIWTKSYLECIRDEFGNHPPNVQGILNHIEFTKAAPTNPQPEVTLAPKAEAPAENMGTEEEPQYEGESEE